MCLKIEATTTLKFFADEEYIKKTGLSSSILGKKITTTEKEIKELILLLKETAIYMVENIRKE